MEATREQETSISLEDATTLLPEAVTKAAIAVKSCASAILKEHTAGGCVDNPGGYVKPDIVLGVEPSMLREHTAGGCVDNPGGVGKPDVVLGGEPPQGSGGPCGVVKGVVEGNDDLVVVEGEEVGGRDEVVVGGEGEGDGDGREGGRGCVDPLEGLVGGEDGEVELEAKEGESPSPILTEGAV